MDEYRQKVLWATFMAGGWGVEYYYGMEGLTVEDYTVYAQAWRDIDHALSFFRSHVRFQDMSHSDHLVGSGNWCLSLKGSQYVVYLPCGGSTSLSLSGVTGDFRIQWFDPRNGGSLVDGTVRTAHGGGIVSISQVLNKPSSDWVAVITCIGFDVK
jgi:hypothetical protein